jgi:putative ABC transport system substrate-binding protein
MARDQVVRLGRRRLLQGSLALLMAVLAILAGCGFSSGWVPQQAKVARVAYLGGSSTAVVNPLLGAFRDGMRQHGYVEGRDFTLEARLAEGRPDRLPELTTDLVASQPDLILVSGDQAIRAVQVATTTIPTVMVSCDAVAAGIIHSLAQPGGNITGTTCISSVVSTKRLQLLRDAFPNVSRVAVIWNAGDAAKAVEAHETQLAAEHLGLHVQSLPVRGPDDFQSAYEAATLGGAEALLILGEALTLAHRKILADYAASSRLPAMYTFREFVDADGLMAYGTNLPNRFRHVATYADKILRGAKPADLPVEQPTEFEFVINLKTAQALGLTIPPPVLQQATELIQ